MLKEGKIRKQERDRKQVDRGEIVGRRQSISEITKDDKENKVKRQTM